MKAAERLLMEAHKMRQFESQCAKGGIESQNRQYRMLTIENLSNLIVEYENTSGQIELQDTMSYLKKIFDNVNADLKKIDFWLHFEDLETLQNKFQKYPVFIPSDIYTKINRRASVGREFRNEFSDLITTDPKKFYDELLGVWVPKYQKLELEILEFEN
jgi:hypothetical protein